MAAYFEGRFQDCVAHGKQCFAYFDRCTGVSWERTTMRHYAIWSLLWLGRLREATGRIRPQLKAALEQGDVYSATDLRIFTSNLMWLIEDDVQGARRVVDEAMDAWSNRGFHAQHYYALYARGNIDVYEGDGVGAWLRLKAAWPTLRSAMLLNIQSVRVEMVHLRARAALVAAQQDANHAGLYLRRAVKDAKSLRREVSLFAPSIGNLVLAAVSQMRGDDDRCIALLRKSIEGFARSELEQFVAAAKRRLGAMDAAEGKGLVEEGSKVMRSEGVVDVERWTDLLAPGFRRQSPMLAAPKGLASIF
ncbi:MAG: hypothetical protein CSA75_05610 [Sorangium cellulosum]|nr:MAG: hypothetical protein CSA75_05610 [Sorangium cellulosum]